MTDLPLLRRALLVSFLTMSCASAMSAEGQWARGSEQGKREYFVDKQGYRLLVACPPASDRGEARSSISLVRLSDGSDMGEFTIKVGKTTNIGSVEATNRLGDSSFVDALVSLRKGDALISFGKQSIVFAKSNAAEVLPSHKSKTMCKLDFDTIFPPKPE
jgi:hypothetical protein